jgi:E3 ubiquitin-protein ligase TRIP12
MLDGVKVEAKTPEGTRIATPNQAANAGPGPSASGSATPRTASYAGAVKTEPKDWHLEFSLKDVKLDMNETLYGVVHKHQDLLSDQANTYGSVFNAPLIIKFKKVEGPPPSSGSKHSILISRRPI